MTDVDDSLGEMSPEDAARWQSARTLGDLGELTAQWLEGAIRSLPTVVPGYGPDEETTLLIPVLAAANRAGYVTEFSQPGEDHDGWIQRAAVSGFASPAVLVALVAASADADLLITAGRAGEADWGNTAVVSIDNGRENTWAGGAQTAEAIRYAYEDDCHPEAVDALCGAWQVTLVDPVWGRNDALWPVLEAFAAKAQPA